MRNQLKSPIFIRFAFFFFSFLVIYSLVIGYVMLNATINYEKEVNQKLNKDIAQQIVKDASPFLDGSVDKGKMQSLMHYLMAVNPSIEIYVLNARGDILTFVAPHKVVKLEKVNLQPIIQFIETDGSEFLMGDDPRNPGNTKVFSAAPVLENNKLLGYVYVILASQEYEGIAGIVQNSTFLQLGVKTFIIITIISLIIGFVLFWITTRNLSEIISVFKEYQNGNLKARISLSSSHSEYSTIKTTFNEMADSLEQKIGQINEIDDLRKELIANISHDLRTPVASIQGYTELLIDKNEELDEEERQKYLSIIDINSKKLERQIRDLFDLSKLESPHYKLHLESLHLGELVTDISNKYKVIANRKGVNLNTIFSKEMPIIKADIALMDRAIQNLVDNALKHTPEGGTINIEIGERNNGLVVKVTDTGEGISEAELPYIFNRYEFGEKNETNSTGLGLAIVKKIVELHQFIIEVASTERVGTTFIMKIPFKISLKS